jgi:hypothetical protein
MIVQCANKGCRSAYQDAHYGMGMRVYNEKLNKQRMLIGTCTVCGIEKSLNGEPTIKLHAPGK